MYFVYNAALLSRISVPSVNWTGWLNNEQKGTALFDCAKSFPSFEAADEAAKAAGWKRYVILQIPVHCECRAFDEPLLGDPDEYSEEF